MSGKMQHIFKKEFRSIDVFSTSMSIKQCVKGISFNFFSNVYPYYLNEIFKSAWKWQTDTTNNFENFILFPRPTQDGKS